MKLTNLLIVVLTFVAFLSCCGEENSAKPSSVAQMTGKFVARPASASQVKWPVYHVGGKDYWQVLREVWREMPELKEEAFVKNAGYSLLGMNYNNRGVLRGDLRKTKLQEFEVHSGGKNRVGELEIEFSSSEADALFYDMELALDGRLNTVGYIIGNSADFRKRHLGVPVKISVSKLTSPVEKIRFVTDVHGCSPIASIEVFDENRAVQNATYERKSNDADWILTFLQPIQGKSLVIQLKTAPTYFKLDPIPAQNKERFKKVPFLTHNFFFRNLISELNPENIDQESIQKVNEEYPDTFVGQIFCEVAANYFQKRTRPERFRDYLTEQGYFLPTYDRDRYDAEAGLRTYVKRYFDFFGNLSTMSGGLMTAPYFYEWGSPIVFSETFTEGPGSYNRSLVTINRSGSRQYSKPWGFYMTSYKYWTRPVHSSQFLTTKKRG